MWDETGESMNIIKLVRTQRWSTVKLLKLECDGSEKKAIIADDE